MNGIIQAAEDLLLHKSKGTYRDKCLELNLAKKIREYKIDVLKNPIREKVLHRIKIWTEAGDLTENDLDILLDLIFGLNWSIETRSSIVEAQAAIARECIDYYDFAYVESTDTPKLLKQIKSDY